MRIDDRCGCVGPVAGRARQWLLVRWDAGDVVCGLLEAFKQQKMHFDASTGRLSMTTASTARDSAGIKSLLKALKKAKARL